MIPPSRRDDDRFLDDDRLARASVRVMRRRNAIFLDRFFQWRTPSLAGGCWPASALDLDPKGMLAGNAARLVLVVGIQRG
jgi:hypothetical protein